MSSGGSDACHWERARLDTAYGRQSLSPGAPSSSSWLPSAPGHRLCSFPNSAHFLLPISLCSQFSVPWRPKCESNFSCATPSVEMTLCFRLPGSAARRDLWNFVAPGQKPWFFQYPFKQHASGGNALCLSNLFVFWLQVPKGILLPGTLIPVPEAGREAFIMHSFCVQSCQNFKDWQLGKISKLLFTA